MGRSLREDRRYQRANRILLDQEKDAFSVKRWFQASIGDAVNQAAQTYPSVFRGAMRSFQSHGNARRIFRRAQDTRTRAWTLLTGGKKNKALKVCRWAKPWRVLAHLESLRGTGAVQLPTKSGLTPRIMRCSPITPSLGAEVSDVDLQTPISPQSPHN